MAMMLFAAGRLATFVASLFIASVLTFLLLSFLPGDPAQTMLGINATPEALATLREQLGTNRPLVEQYVNWASGLLHGDFGVSAVSGVSIGAEIAQKLTVTVPLVVGGMAVAVLLSVPLGVLAAVRHRQPMGTLLSGLSQVGIAIPAFWLGILLITALAVELQVLPAGGFPDAGWADLSGALEALVLPVAVLGIAQGAILMRYVRSSVLDVMQDDFVRTARAKGLSRGAALRKHALRNAAIPVITVLGLQLATLLIGAVVIEKVFNLPGLGSMLLQDVGNRDLLKVQGVVIVLTGAVLLVNLLVDLIYHLVDPRLRDQS